MEVESRGLQRLRLHLPHVGDQVRGPDRRPASRDRRRRDRSFKIFLAYKNFFGVDDGEMYQTLTLAKKLGVIVTAHCENAELVGRLQQMLLAQGKTGPEWHEPSRPESVEAEGTNRFATFLENTGAAGYVVHLSCEARAGAAMAAKSRGVRLWVESVSRIFMLDKTYAERAGRRRHEARHVAAAARQAQSESAVERAGSRASSIPSAPTIAPSIRRKSCWAKMPSRKFPTAFRESKSASTCSTPTA